MPEQDLKELLINTYNQENALQKATNEIKEETDYLILNILLEYLYQPPENQ
jgi:hypothetical protein